MAQARSGLMSVTGTAEPWARILDAAGVPCAVVQDLAALPSDPHTAAVGLVQESRTKPVRYRSSARRTGSTVVGPRCAAPHLCSASTRPRSDLVPARDFGPTPPMSVPSAP